MVEFIIVAESEADNKTATELAERVLLEKVEWLEADLLPHTFRWSGLQENTNFSSWKNVKKIINEAKEAGIRPPRFISRPAKNSERLRADGAAAVKVLNLIRQLQKERSIRAVLLIRDLDNQAERRAGLEQAREEHAARQLELEIVIGTADRMREAWVLNGFIPLNSEEEKALQRYKTILSFDPCVEAHRLRSTSFAEPDRSRNPKVVVEELTGRDANREAQCWQITGLGLLRERGIHTGLTDYLHEIEGRLGPIVVSK